MGVTGIGAGLNPSTWTDALATNAKRDVFRSGKKVWFSYLRDSNKIGDINTTVTGSGATFTLNVTEGGGRFTRSGTNCQLDFDDWLYSTSASSGTQTFNIRIKLTAETSTNNYYLFQDSSNYIGFYNDATNLGIRCAETASSTSETVALSGIDMTAYIWLRMIITNNTTLQGYYSEDNVETPDEATFTQIGSDITTNIPDLTDDKFRIDNSTNNKTITIQSFSYE